MTQESGVSPSDEVSAFREKVLRKLTYSVGKDSESASDYDWFEAVALAARDHIIDHWMECTRQTYEGGCKRVYYLSLEFLIGRLLVDSLSNLGLFEVAREALAELDVDIERIRLLEPDAALGNGGLGRLAACFMESMATLQVAAHGYGIRYDHGLFRQAIVDGWQHEQTETWLDFGNPWEFERPEVSYLIGFGGHVTAIPGEGGGEVPPLLALGRGRAGDRLRHADRRLARRQREHPAPMARAGRGGFPPGALQRRRPHRRGG